MVNLWTPPGADLGDMAGPDPDERMVHFAGGVGPNGQALPMSYKRLEAHAVQNYVITDTTPEGPANLLDLARSMFALGYYRYDMVAASACWSIFAVEAALKLRLGAGPNVSMSNLIKKAQEQGLISDYLADILHTGREIRNRFVHEGTRPVWTFGMAGNAIGASFKIVAELYPASR